MLACGLEMRSKWSQQTKNHFCLAQGDADVEGSGLPCSFAVSDPVTTFQELETLLLPLGFFFLLGKNKCYLHLLYR